MKVEIKHHYGWRQYDVPAETLEQAAYLAIRQAHEFLTDHNHTHQAVDRVTKWAGQENRFLAIEILRNENSPTYTGPAWATTDYWISVSYRVPIATAVTTIGVDLAKDPDQSVLQEVEVANGKATVIPGGRRIGKKAAAKKAQGKATTTSPE